MRDWRCRGGGAALRGALMAACWLAAVGPTAAQTDEELRCQAVARTLLGDESVRITGRTSLPGGEVLVTWRSDAGDAGRCTVDLSGRIDSVIVEERAGSLFGGGAAAPADWDAYSVTCSSERDRRTECKIRAGSRVELEEQLSRSDCVAGESWGYLGEALWVDRGCRGIFEVSPAGPAATPRVSGGPQTPALRAQEACRRQAEALGLTVERVAASTPVAGGYRVDLRLVRPGRAIDASCAWDARTGQAQLAVR